MKVSRAIVARFRTLATTSQRDIICYPQRKATYQRESRCLMTHDGQLICPGDRVRFPQFYGDTQLVEGVVAEVRPDGGAAFAARVEVRYTLPTGQTGLVGRAPGELTLDPQQSRNWVN